MNKLKQFSVFHPFLFAIFPILSLFAYNIDEVPAADLALPLLVAVTLTLVVFLLFRMVTNDYDKVAIVTSYFVILFFSYGHVRDAIFPDEIARGSPTINLLLLSCWALLFAAGAFFTIRSRRSLSVVTKFASTMSISLIAISLITIGICAVKTAHFGHQEVGGESNGLHLTNPYNPPDIYYIILDTYAREDILEEVLDYDNSEFINYLSSKGFYVAAKSSSTTFGSTGCLASYLNMRYLKPEELSNKSRLLEMICDSKVSQLLKSAGYRYIFVSGGWDIKGMGKYADVYSYNEAFGIKVSAFIEGLSDTTALSPFARLFSSHGVNTRLYAFDALGDIPEIDEPTFTYAHIMCPHQSWLFDSDGPREFHMFADPLEFPEGYLGNLAFINGKVQGLVHELLSKSDVPPVIILQGDHGLRWPEGSNTREILNAYYFPEKGYDLLYETITPVNSFRVVFNHYYGTNYDLLKDKS